LTEGLHSQFILILFSAVTLKYQVLPESIGEVVMVAEVDPVGEKVPESKSELVATLTQYFVIGDPPSYETGSHSNVTFSLS
jgi:hypothetical protein